MTISGDSFDAVLAIVPDEGAAAVIQEALAGDGVPMEARPVSYDPYRPTPTGTTLELRVPRVHLAEAERVLARLEAEVAEEVDAQARAAAPEESAAHSPRRR